MDCGQDISPFTEPFLELWEQEVFALLLAQGKITQKTAASLVGRNSARFYHECPLPVGHTPGTSEKQMPISQIIMWKARRIEHLASAQRLSEAIPGTR